MQLSSLYQLQLVDDFALFVPFRRQIHGTVAMERPVCRCGADRSGVRSTSDDVRHRVESSGTAQVNGLSRRDFSRCESLRALRRDDNITD